MTKPHKHAELIKAWADGAQIEFWNERAPGKGKWMPANLPNWYPDFQYRLAPTKYKYRLYLYKFSWTNCQLQVGSINNAEEELAIPKSKYFVRWLGEWQTIQEPDD